MKRTSSFVRYEATSPLARFVAVAITIALILVDQFSVIPMWLTAPSAIFAIIVKRYVDLKQSNAIAKGD